MTNRLKQLLSLALAAVLILAQAASAHADDGPADSAAVTQETEDSGIIDGAALKQWMDDFAARNDLLQAYKRFSVGFWYSGTGDSWYYDADEWMYSASMYKVPVAMLMAEKEAAGELTQDSIINGTTLEYLESTALIYSNNDSGHSMVSWLGGTYNGKCSDQTIRFTDLPNDYFDQDFYDVSYYTARYMTQVMRTLYEGGEERFPHLIGFLKQAQPGAYFKKDAALSQQAEIAQKFGAFEEGNGNNNNHCTAIIYTPNPIVVTVMTRNVGGYQDVIAAVGGYLAEYALQLDQKLEEYRQAEAARAVAEAMMTEADAQVTEPADEAGYESEAEFAAEPADMNTAEAAPTMPADEPAPITAPVEEQPAERGFPLWPVIVIPVLVLTAAAVFLLLRRRSAWEEEDEEDEEDDDAEQDGQPTGRRQADRPKAGGYRPRH